MERDAPPSSVLSKDSESSSVGDGRKREVRERLRKSIPLMRIQKGEKGKEERKAFERKVHVTQVGECDM